MPLSPPMTSSLPGAQPRFQSWGPIPWSRVLLPLYRKKQVYPVWCSRLHNHTIHKKLCKKLGVRLNFWDVRTPPRLPLVVPMVRAFIWRSIAKHSFLVTMFDYVYTTCSALITDYQLFYWCCMFALQAWMQLLLSGTHYRKLSSIATLLLFLFHRLSHSYRLSLQWMSTVV